MKNIFENLLTGVSAYGMIRPVARHFHFGISPVLA